MLQIEDFYLEHVSEQEIEKSMLTGELTISTWQMACNPFKIKKDGNIVGYIDITPAEMWKNDKNTQSIMIDHFEIFNKGAGLGTNFIAKFIKKYGHLGICLYPYSTKSNNFWVNQGFEKQGDGTGASNYLVYEK